MKNSIIVKVLHKFQKFLIIQTVPEFEPVKVSSYLICNPKQKIITHSK